MGVSEIKHKELKRELTIKHRRLLEEAYSIKYTEDSLSDVLTFEAIQLENKLRFLQLG